MSIFSTPCVWRLESSLKLISSKTRRLFSFFLSFLSVPYRSKVENSFRLDKPLAVWDMPLQAYHVSLFIDRSASQWKSMNCAHTWGSKFKSFQCFEQDKGAWLQLGGQMSNRYKDYSWYTCVTRIIIIVINHCREHKQLSFVSAIGCTVK